MDLNNNVLEYIYKHKPDSFQWLKKYQCVHFIDHYFNDTTNDSIRSDIKSAYNILVRTPSYTHKHILENIIKVNTKQLSFLHDNNYILNQYIDDNEMACDGSYNKQHIQLIDTHIHKQCNIRQRSVCLYFRDEGENKPSSCSTNGIDLYIMSVFLEMLLRDKKLRMFNNFYIVPRKPGFYPSVLEQWMVDCRGMDFIYKTCIYTNTLHLSGLTLPDLSAGTVPIVGLMCRAQQTTRCIDNQCVNIPFFSAGQHVHQGDIVYNTEDKIFHDNHIYTQHDYITKFNIMSKARNNSVFNTCYYMYMALQELEAKYLDES